VEKKLTPWEPRSSPGSR